MHTTPVSLLQRLRDPSAERAAWERFTGLYTPLIFFWLRRQGLQQADAADLVQDVFVTLVQKLPEFAYDPGRSFRSWLRTVTLNKLRERRRRVQPGQAGDSALNELPDPAVDEQFWDREYQRELMRRALEVLRGDFETATWEAFQRHVMQGRPAPKVAAELGMTPNAVRAARFRVVCRLRQELAGLLE